MSQKTTLRDLEHHDAFIARHIGPNDAEIAHCVIAMKGELERFREQLENIE